MKQKIHPDYQDVLFIDSSNGARFICGSTVKSNKKEVVDGVEYPVVHVSVSSASHPFFTGSKGLIDTEGRVQKFMNRYKKAEEQLKEVAVQGEHKEEATKKARKSK
ncbi:MAG: type B 50S ribosomal protein L31 [Chlamydiota bacterium]